MFSFTPFLFLTVLLSVSSIVQAKVPLSKTFSFLFEEFSLGGLQLENHFYYTDLGISKRPFRLCFYGLDSRSVQHYSEITLAIRLDDRIVWEANRGKPVHVNGRFIFGENGNLALVEANGDVLWETKTANKGVVDLKMLPNGNLVLVDQRGKFIWQSFDHPTDTILVGQSLHRGNQNKLVSRVSSSDNRAGSYSVVINGGRVIFYYKSKLSPKPEIYSFMESIAGVSYDSHPYEKMTFQSGLMDGEAYTYYLMFNFTSVDSTTYTIIPAGLQLRYNPLYSFLRLGQDGNLRIFTYFDKVRDPLMTGGQWDETFTVFSSRFRYEGECQLPEKCGRFGVCQDNQCVACPTANGLIGWSKRCAPPKLPSCNKTGVEVDYYRINGVDHFSSNFSGSGPMRFGKCKEKCSKDCRCSGFFYRKDTSRCLITTHLNTLTRVSQSNHLAFIKFTK